MSRVQRLRISKALPAPPAPPEDKKKEKGAESSSQSQLKPWLRTANSLPSCPKPRVNNTVLTVESKVKNINTDDDVDDDDNNNNNNSNNNNNNNNNNNKQTMDILRGGDDARDHGSPSYDSSVLHDLLMDEYSYDSPTSPNIHMELPPIPSKDPQRNSLSKSGRKELPAKPSTGLRSSPQRSQLWKRRHEKGDRNINVTSLELDQSNCSSVPPAAVDNKHPLPPLPSTRASPETRTGLPGRQNRKPLPDLQALDATMGTEQSKMLKAKLKPPFQSRKSENISTKAESTTAKVSPSALKSQSSTVARSLPPLQSSSASLARSTPPRHPPTPDYSLGDKIHPQIPQTLPTIANPQTPPHDNPPSDSVTESPPTTAIKIPQEQQPSNRPPPTSTKISLPANPRPPRTDSRAAPSHFINISPAVLSPTAAATATAITPLSAAQRPLPASLQVSNPSSFLSSTSSAPSSSFPTPTTTKGANAGANPAYTAYSSSSSSNNNNSSSSSISTTRNAAQYRSAALAPPPPTQQQQQQTPSSTPRLGPAPTFASASTSTSTSASASISAARVATALPPAISVTQLRCFQAHRHMRASRNDVCPVACMVCRGGGGGRRGAGQGRQQEEEEEEEEVGEESTRWMCVWCDLRACGRCTRELRGTEGRDLAVLLARLGVVGVGGGGTGGGRRPTTV